MYDGKRGYRYRRIPAAGGPLHLTLSLRSETWEVVQKEGGLPIGREWWSADLFRGSFFASFFGMIFRSVFGQILNVFGSSFLMIFSVLSHRIFEDEIA